MVGAAIEAASLWQKSEFFKCADPLQLVKFLFTVACIACVFLFMYNFSRVFFSHTYPPLAPLYLPLYFCGDEGDWKMITLLVELGLMDDYQMVTLDITWFYFANNKKTKISKIGCSAFLTTKYFIFTDGEILLTSQKRAGWVVRWELVGERETVAIGICIGRVADVEVVSSTKGWAGSSVAANPIDTLIALWLHLDWPNSLSVRHTEQERLGTGVPFTGTLQNKNRSHASQRW